MIPVVFIGGPAHGEERVVDERSRYWRVEELQSHYDDDPDAPVSFKAHHYVIEMLPNGSYVARHV